MKADCHIHMVLDGIDWKKAIGRHREQVDLQWVRGILAHYQQQGFTYLRDGGDRWGVGKAARDMAWEYGITYRTPLAPICKAGHYGSFIGQSYENLRQYAQMVRQAKRQGADFIKIMISGLMDFDHAGALTEAGLAPEEIRELISIAHQEGMAVMAHANGAACVTAAAQSGVDSVEHGAYLDAQALAAMKENHVIWCPTLSTVGNLRGSGRFDERAVRLILESAAENVEKFANMGGILTLGSDAGAWAVPHGSRTEYDLMEQILGSRVQNVLQQGVEETRKRF